MQRRKFIAGVGSLAAGAAAVTGTGAVSSVTADRTVSLAIEEDSAAYLGLDAQDTTYVSENGKGVIEFAFNKLNNRADTTFEDLFQIENNSQNDLWVTAALAGPSGTAIDPTSGGARSVEILAGGTDITYPGDTSDGETKDDSDAVVPPKSDFPETSRALGQTSTTGAVNIGTGNSTDVDMRFLVYGSSGDRSNDFRIVLKAVDSDPTPTGKGDHMIGVNGSP